MPSKSPAEIAARVAIQLPLIAKTDGCARYSTAFAGRDAAARHEPDVGERPGQRVDHAEPAESVGREQLELGQPGAQAALHLGRGRDAGQHAEPELQRAGDHVVVDARG